MIANHRKHHKRYRRDLEENEIKLSPFGAVYDETYESSALTNHENDNLYLFLTKKYEEKRLCMSL